ncbi:FkbM family methyltransferase [Aliiglaciecola sp. LCG003]|uniref:FkbM family methyltransferase n=1 Tax=Aliiglaciecola sp. LCG003 TaxID=3053655 RepID=UPI002573ADD3|nr:FkbM family methyltransferase [Aliiglaciecola sp. LCG003]WJG10595.1 FkbM family methyltransferase [Aliiglaciecola sp. LCG003]
MNIFASLFEMLKETKSFHAHSKHFHAFSSEVCTKLIEQSGFSSNEEVAVDFGPFGHIVFPYYSMGNIDSLKLFGLDELILFSFYHANQCRYKRTADMGANIGLHSILMSRLGWHVTAFEPDPIHVAKIKQHAELNSISTINIRENAVSNESGTLVFTRLKGNRTGSHLKGKKSNVYGDIDEFEVQCVALTDVMAEFDFIKMDIEGAEVDAICSTSKQHWQNTDMMLEVGSEENACRILKHIHELELHAYSQKMGWRKVENINHMPFGYKEGSLFISAQAQLVWDI